MKLWLWWKDKHLKHLQAENEAMRDQIRLMKTRHFPDIVWVEAFSLGFSKAWDMMMPLMEQGMKEAQVKVRDTAIQETVSNLETLIRNRAQDICNGNLISTD